MILKDIWMDVKPYRSVTRQRGVPWRCFFSIRVSMP